MCLKANIYSQSRRRELQKTNCFEQIVIEKTRAEVRLSRWGIGHQQRNTRDITRRQAEVGKRKKKKKRSKK